MLMHMQENQIRRPSWSPWASLNMLVKKKDGTVQFCVESISIPSLYEIPIPYPGLKIPWWLWCMSGISLPWVWLAGTGKCRFPWKTGEDSLCHPHGAK